MNNNIVCFVKDDSIKNFIYRNKNLFFSLKKKFKKITIINFSQSKIAYKSQNIKIIKVNNFLQLLKIIKKKQNNLAVNFLKKNFNNLHIFILLKFYNIKFFETYLTGDIKNFKIYFNKSVLISFTKICHLLSKSFAFFLYNIFAKITIIQRPIFLLHLSEDYNEQILSSFDNLIRNKLNIFILNFLKFFNFLYYDKIYLINKPLKKIQKKNVNSSYIVFLDSCFNHIDRKIYDRIPSNSETDYYYEKLSVFFSKIQKIYKKKLFFLKHPDTEIIQIKKRLKNIKIISNNTDYYIVNSKLVLFHESSTIIYAILLKKKIINLQSCSMGRYFKFRNKLYSKKINIPSINIDNDVSLKYVKKKITNSNIKYEKYFNYSANNKRDPGIIRHDIGRLLDEVKINL